MTGLSRQHIYISEVSGLHPHLDLTSQLHDRTSDQDHNAANEDNEIHHTVEIQKHESISHEASNFLTTDFCPTPFVSIKPKALL